MKCRYFMNGHCIYGDQCRFSHDLQNSIRDQELEQLRIRYKQTYKNDHLQIQLELKPTDPEFPFDLESLKLRFIVPSNYPSDPAQDFKVGNPEIPQVLRDRICEELTKKSGQNPRLRLLHLMNWLDRNLEEFLIDPLQPLSSKPNSIDDNAVAEKISQAATSSNSSEVDITHNQPVVVLTKEISPSNITTSNEPEEILQPNTSIANDGTKIILKNPNFLHISLLECTHLFLLMQCTRCRKNQIVENIHSSLKPRSLNCSTCKNSWLIRFRPNIMFPAKEVNIGSIDCNGCIVSDLLPSHFLPTCSECFIEEETDIKPVKFRNVKIGIRCSQNCSNCHSLMSFEIQEFKIVNARVEIKLESLVSSMKLKTPKQKDQKEIIHGQPLPNKGTCAHYKKSYRWFRFPCCGVAYPCDICHEENKTTDHEMKNASRMICGFCAKEQPVNAICVKCENNNIQTSTTNFWEGGKGTRNKKAMSRKDTHKYRGLNKTVSNKGERVGKKE